MKQTRQCFYCVGETDESRVLPEAINFISERFPSMDPSVPADGTRTLVKTCQNSSK